MFDYRFQIPTDHPPGTHWYHPHHHGMVADQLFGGLLGALLVDDGPDIPPPMPLQGGQGAPAALDLGSDAGRNASTSIYGSRAISG